MSTSNLGFLVSKDLIAALRKRFPLERPRIDEHERAVWIKSGNQEVIEFLEAHHQAAIQNALEQ